MGRIYGDQVQVDYYDVADSATLEQHKELIEAVPDGYLYYPLVFVNGQLKVTGGADPYQVMYAVQAVLKEAQQA